MNSERSALLIRIGICLVAALLIVSALRLPLWEMELIAPQYPQGLHLIANGDRITGDIREVNILNQYIGMKELSERPAPEMALYRWSIGGLLLLVLIAPFWRMAYRAAAFGAMALPIGILADMQLWLRWYGHHLDHDAPIRLKPFTPLVLGPSKVGQFATTAELEMGGDALLAAGLLLIAGLAIDKWRRRERTEPTSKTTASRKVPSIAAATMLLLFFTPFALPADAAVNPLQLRIDRAAPHSTLIVERGVYLGGVTVRKPLHLIGQGRPVIDALGSGSVVSIDADDVVVRGFVLCNGGRNTIDEAAGVKLRGNRNRIEENVIRDVHFGIHAIEGKGNRIRQNEITPARGRGYRGGDGINLWQIHDSLIDGNVISSARDGIYLSFTSGVVISGNGISGSRYGIHSMFSQNIRVEKNHLRSNLLGAAMMYSDRLVFRGNRVEEHRTGSTPYGVLLKDIGDLQLEENTFTSNRVAIYADGTPDEARHQAIIRRNQIVGNDTAFLLQNTVRLTVTENAIVDNLSDVVSEEGALSNENRWSLNGRGNFWSEYRGYDRDGDGIGELPYRVAGSFDYLMHRNPMMRAFLYTPAHTALDLATRMFPLFRPEPLLSDPAPLTRPPQWKGSSS
jgi:nitrous oxidase accessory protein